jgi:hypothetical protein
VRSFRRDGVDGAALEAEAAQAAVEELLRSGLGMQDIAAAARVSLGAAQRAAGGHGFVRRATQDALLQAAAVLTLPLDP